MTKTQIEDKYFVDFLNWCAHGCEAIKPSDLMFWLDHNQVNVDNFWEWVARYKVDEIGASDEKE